MTNGNWFGWRLLPKNRQLTPDSDKYININKRMRIEPPINFNERGYHASRHAFDALKYANGPVVCRVQLSGEIVDVDDRTVATDLTPLACADATKEIQKFGCWCAASVLHLTRTDEPVCQKAIEAKLAWLNDEATDEELAAALTDLHEVKFCTAKISAYYALDSVQLAVNDYWIDSLGATTKTPWDAAYSAARTVGNQSWVSIWKTYNDELTRRFLDLLETRSHYHAGR